LFFILLSQSIRYFSSKAFGGLGAVGGDDVSIYDYVLFDEDSSVVFDVLLPSSFFIISSCNAFSLEQSAVGDE